MATVAASVFVAPLVGLMLRVEWSSLVADLTAPEAIDALRLSLVCTLAATALSMLLGMPLAWVLARARFPGRAVLRGVVLLPLVLPPVVGGVALLSAFSRTGLIGQRLYDWFGIQLTFSTAGVVLAATFVAMPFFVITAEAALRAVDQRFEEVSSTLGAGPWTTFRRVTLPSIAPAVGAGAVLAGARALGEFGATITFAGNIVGRTQTLPLAIYMALQGDVNVAIGLSLVLLAVSLVVMVVAMRDRWRPDDAPADAPAAASAEAPAPSRTWVPAAQTVASQSDIVSSSPVVGSSLLAGSSRAPSEPTSASIELRLGALELSAELAVGPGEVLAVIGPNGSGKSTLLRCLAGLQAVDAGRVVVGGELVDDASSGAFVWPEDRNVGVLFQDDLLFPHMDLLDNVAYGPLARGASTSDAAAAADVWLERVGVGAHRRSRPRQVSGGQAQRAALARALVTEPDLLLLDEPLSALDAATRVTLRRELREHLGGFGGATVLVTHDALDALALADRVVVVEEGRITQSGSLTEVVGTPRTEYVAELMATNLLSGTAHATTVSLTPTESRHDSASGSADATAPASTGGSPRSPSPASTGGSPGSPSSGSAQSDGRRPTAAPGPSPTPARTWLDGAGAPTVVVSEPHDGPVLVLIRPSSVTLHRDPPDGSPRNRWPVEIVGFDPLGDRVRVRLVGPVPLIAEVTSAAVEEMGLEIGMRLWCAVKATDVVVVDR